MKVMLATGIEELDHAIMNRITNVSYVESVLSQEFISSYVSKYNPDLLILSELFVSGKHPIPIKDIIIMLRTQFPKTRIIFLGKDENKEQEMFLHHWMIFDIFSGPFTVEELKTAIQKPKSFYDVIEKY